MKNAVVIGAGFAGLAASSLLAREGWRVTLVEKNDEVGGRARLWKSGGYTFDMGPSWYLMPEVFERFFTAMGARREDYYRIQRLDPAYEGELAERLGLGEQLDKYPYQLSRGQQQRVAIARALLHKPDLVLADEPTGNLDESSSLEVMALFSELVKSAGSSLLMVTHSQAMAAFMDRRVNLHNGRLAEVQ